MKRIGAAMVLAAAALFGAGAPSATAAGVEDFYKGRSVNLIIGYSVGGGYDLYARVLARHLGRHIPENPTILPQNTPGAVSPTPTTYLDSRAPTDGSVIATSA